MSADIRAFGIWSIGNPRPARPARPRGPRLPFALRRVAAVLMLLAAASIVRAQTPAPRFRVEEATIADIQRALLTGRVTTVELVEDYLRRIQAYNGVCVQEPQGRLGPIKTVPHAGRINALSTLNLRPAARERWGFDARKARSLTNAADADPHMPDALEAAAEQDRVLGKNGELVGPLQGVIMAVKDQYDTYDMRTTSGADVDYADDRPPDDATVVARLRAAGAIILAKANMAEYAVDGARSSFGGTFCNPYDTEREPGMSSAGSATSVAANLVTCAIGEETVVSIRWPAAVNSLVGLAPTQELVSRDGMMGAGLIMRTGPLCKTVQDTARVLNVIAGYDPKDAMTVYAVGRKPPQAYAGYAVAGRLAGLRVGVVREYMRQDLFTKADEQSLALVERAVEDLGRLGATIVDPGRGAALFRDCIERYAPEWLTSAFTRRYPLLFPYDADGEPASDHIATLLDMHFDLDRVPPLSLRDLGAFAPGFGLAGEDRYMIDRYLRERGDANIHGNADLIAKARFYDDPHFPDRRQARERAQQARTVDTSLHLQNRFAFQTLLLQCMQQQNLDVLVAPTSSVPPRRLTAPREPTANGRPAIGWSFFGQQGFPVMTVPAGFTTEVWDRAPTPDGGTRLVGPVSAALPVGVDFVARPFAEALLFRVGAAYEAATRHRRAPPDFGPLAGE